MNRDELPPELRHMPIDPDWNMPIPFINERDGDHGHFAVLDPRRALICYQRRLCAMCGLKMGDEVALYGDVVSLEPDGFYIEAPVHERCLELALGGVCPFISRENYRRRLMTDPSVVVLGDRDVLHQVGREIAKRPALMVIARTYELVVMVTDQGQMPVYRTPGGIVRMRRFGWVDGRAREVQPEPGPREPERRVTVVRVQRRRPKGRASR